MSRWTPTHKGWKNYLIEMLQEADLEIDPKLTSRKNIERLFPSEYNNSRKYTFDPEGRKCNTCLTRKPWNMFFKGSGANGHIQKCKSCCAKKHKEKSGRKCIYCYKHKPFSQFYKSSYVSKKTGSSPYQSLCKDCVKMRNHERYHGKCKS